MPAVQTSSRMSPFSGLASFGEDRVPLGGVHSWKGFVFEAEREPYVPGCGLAPAEDELPNPLELELKASPAALTGNRPKLVFHRSRTFNASKSEGSLRSSATAKWTYTVTLVHR